jgi:poly-gamma-glutamate capsule biosynthesis protein CapA/YwtB (metallophosphatase superfamily)
MARRAGWRRALMVAGMLALSIAPSACTASGRAGGHTVQPVRASAATPPRHHETQSRSVQLVVEASGDLLIHSAVFDRALVLGHGHYYDFTPMFAQIKPYIQGADLALCHVETPMTPAPPTGYPTFNTPPDLATAIRQTGWRACSTAGTHSLDQGQTGVDDTIRALDRAGVAHTGTFSSAAAQQTPLIMTVKGVRVAFLAYTDITNGIPSPHPWSVNRASAAQILSDAHRARQDGAQAVIVNLHWGDQYVAQPSSFQLALASRLTRSPDITAIVGQHVHIVQPIRMINGKPVVFGEGNLISNQTSACCPAASQDGMIVLLTFTVNSRGARVTFIRYVPIWVRHPDYAVLPAGTEWRNDPADSAALRASYARTVAAVGRGPGIQPVPAHLLSADTLICRGEREGTALTAIGWRGGLGCRRCSDHWSVRVGQELGRSADRLPARAAERAVCATRPGLPGLGGDRQQRSCRGVQPDAAQPGRCGGELPAGRHRGVRAGILHPR